MDTGEGRFELFDNEENKKKLFDIYGKDRSVFEEGEEIIIKNSRFRISKIIRNGLKLELLPDEPIEEYKSDVKFEHEINPSRHELRHTLFEYIKKISPGSEMADSKVQDLLNFSEAKIQKLRKALIGLIGAETKEELEQMELYFRSIPAPEQDKIVSINAIHALIETIG